MRAFALAVVLFATPAVSQPIEYVYTKFDAKKCKHERGKQVEDYGVRATKS